MSVPRLSALSFALVLVTQYGTAATLTTIHTFAGGPGDGGRPVAGLVMGPGGVLYGTASEGGTGGIGTVFSLTPPATPGGAWTEAVIYNFTNTGGDGRNPQSTLAIDSKGVLYGTTPTGGLGTGGGVCTVGCGMAFSLTPPGSPGGAWTETILHDFGVHPGDGYLFSSGLVIGPHGALFGTTRGDAGRSPKGGTVFRLNPPATPGGAWTETILHSFAGPPGDGSYPNGVIAMNGALYGSTQNGGSANNGTVFRLSPPPVAGGAWTETILFNFSPADVNNPVFTLAAGAAGVLYGAAYDDAASTCLDCGAVFALAPPSSPGGAWVETDIYELATGGQRQPSGLLYGPGGALFVSSLYGGSNDNGMITELSPPSGAGGPWVETALYTFDSNLPAYGIQPMGNLITDASGNLYGVTGQSGLGYGTVFELTP